LFWSSQLSVREPEVDVKLEVDEQPSSPSNWLAKSPPPQHPSSPSFIWIRSPPLQLRDVELLDAPDVWNARTDPPLARGVMPPARPNATTMVRATIPEMISCGNVFPSLPCFMFPSFP
jgi:hypothetical protein